MEGFLLLIPVVIVIAIVVRLVMGAMDRDRIREYVGGQGGQLLEASWSPLGPGWAGEKSDRIYRVQYLDREGNEHQAHCKTSMWTGVYLTEDRIVKYAEPPIQAAGDLTALEAENQRLREEVERLRRERG